MKISATATYRPRMDSGQFMAAVINPGVVASVEASDQLVLSEALAIVPVDTGELKASGAVVPVVQKGSTVVGGVCFSANHAAYVEYGTGIRGASSPGAGPYPYSTTWPGMRAQPYLRPALDVARKAIAGIFASQVALRLKK
jgi:hypothetical protein